MTTPSLPTSARPRREPADDGGRREVFVPLFMLTIGLAALSLVVSFFAAQDTGTAAPSGVSAAKVHGEVTTSHLVRPELVKATATNFDAVAQRYDPATQPVAAGPKTFHLTMAEQRVKIGDRVVEMWTFNGTSPGPALRAVVGDKVTVHLTNSSKSKMLHSVDFHASRMSMGGGDVQVAPGKTGTFTFTADYPGVFMYHCATAPVLEHISRGMYGMLIVQPKGGFGAKMPEYAVVQSELYRDFPAMQVGNESAVVMNGIPKQYVQAPIKEPVGQHVRLFFLDAGPNVVSSFHIVGTVFDKVYADGNPRNATYGRQAIAVPVSGAIMAEFQLVGDGMFPFVTHSFHDVDSGAVGMFQAGDGKRGPGAATAPMSH